LDGPKGACHGLSPSADEPTNLRCRDVDDYVIITLNCKASEALDMWSSIAPIAREIGVKLFVMWTGSCDMPPEEIGSRIGNILAKMDVTEIICRR